MFIIEPYFNSRYERYGYKQLFNYLDSQRVYDQIVISNKIDGSHQYIHYLYFGKINPTYYSNNVKRTRFADGWINLEYIGNYKFTNSAAGIELIPKKSLLVVGENEVSFTVGPIFVIDDLRGDRLFEVYDVDQVKKSLEETAEN